MRILSIAKQAWARGSADNVGLLAAGVAFYAFLAMVPLLAALVLSYGLFASPADAVRHARSIAGALPPAAASLVIDQMKDLVTGDGGKTALGFAIALGTALYGATKGAKAVIIALNVVNGSPRHRSFLKQTRASFLVILLLLGVFLAGFGAIALTTLLEKLLPGLSATLGGVLKALGMLAFPLVATAALGIIYRFAPADARPSLRAAFLAAACAALLLALATLAFGIYVANFGSYNATYGALGAVVVLQLWFYLAAFTLLLGGELATVIDREGLPAAP